MRIFSPITISLSPNTEKDDVVAALSSLAAFFWGKSENAETMSLVKTWFQRRFGVEEIHFANSGRSALLLLLQSFDIGKGDDVIVQAFTCVAVPNSVLWAGARPVYVDCTSTYNLDPKDLERKVTKRTKAIIVQHTFGIPADMDAIMKIAKKHALIVIEDCAHSLGATYKGKLVGTMGDAAFFSFGRDKVLSSVFGGAAILNTSQQSVRTKLRSLFDQLSLSPRRWVFQQLVHPVCFAIILPLYTLNIGKVILLVLQKLQILSKPVYREELKGGRPEIFPTTYPEVLAPLLLRQLQKVDRYNAVRKQRAIDYYKALKDKKIGIVSPEIEGAIYLRFPLQIQSAAKIRTALQQKNILIGNWYHRVIDPAGVDFQAVGYTLGSCPNAEKYAQEILNLPTLVPSVDARKVLDELSSQV